MMGEVSLETSPKHIMIQDMINSENSTNNLVVYCDVGQLTFEARFWDRYTRELYFLWKFYGKISLEIVSG